MGISVAHPQNGYSSTVSRSNWNLEMLVVSPAISLVYLHGKWRLARAFLPQEIRQRNVFRTVYLYVVWSLHSKVSWIPTLPPPPPRQSPAPIPKIFFAVSLLVLELSLKQTKILRVKEIAGLQIFSISAGHKRKITYSATPGQLNTIRV